MTTLALLVGSNPLPNYLAARALSWERAVLFFTPQTEQVKERLARLLQRAYSEREITSQLIRDGTRARDVHSAWHNAFPNQGEPIHLHYTGGTKSMAVHLHADWQQMECGQRNASYLDDSNRLLRYDDGTDTPLDELDIAIDLDALAGMHGLDGHKERRPAIGPDLPGDAVALARALIRDPDKAAQLFAKVPKALKELKEIPFQPSELGLDLSAGQIPAEGMSRRSAERWQRFLRGEWLEEWVAAVVAQVCPDKVHVGVKAKLDKRQFEVDVIAIRGHRLYLISCTTSDRIGLCKSKLFEVAMRAKQLGGDLARSSLACFLDGYDSRGELVGELQKDVTATWGSPNVPKVFGLAHLAEWLDGRTVSLETWLKS